MSSKNQPRIRVDIDKEIAEARRRHDEEVAKWREADATVSFLNGIADKLAADFNVHTSGAVGWITHGCMVLEITLREDQSVADCEPILKQLRSNGAYRVPVYSGNDVDEYMPQVNWKLETRDPGGGWVDIMLRVWVKGSTVCQIVDTGETRPVRKLVCPETA